MRNWCTSATLLFQSRAILKSHVEEPILQKQPTLQDNTPAKQPVPMNNTNAEQSILHEGIDTKLEMLQTLKQEMIRLASQQMGIITKLESLPALRRLCYPPLIQASLWPLAINNTHTILTYSCSLNR